MQNDYRTSSCLICLHRHECTVYQKFLADLEKENNDMPLEEAIKTINPQCIYHDFSFVMGRC